MIIKTGLSKTTHRFPKILCHKDEEFHPDMPLPRDFHLSRAAGPCHKYPRIIPQSMSSWFCQILKKKQQQFNIILVILNCNRIKSRFRIMNEELPV